MKKIIITQYSKEPTGSTIGAWTYHFGINFNGNYSYSVVTTLEGIGEMQVALKRGNEVEFIRRWEQETAKS